MHLHQFDQIVIAEDGYPLDHPYTVDTLNVAPGQRFTVLVQLEERGTWVWHCHILPHVENGSPGCSGWSPRWSSSEHAAHDRQVSAPSRKLTTVVSQSSGSERRPAV